MKGLLKIITGPVVLIAMLSLTITFVNIYNTENEVSIETSEIVEGVPLMEVVTDEKPDRDYSALLGLGVMFASLIYVSTSVNSKRKDLKEVEEDTEISLPQDTIKDMSTLIEISRIEPLNEGLNKLHLRVNKYQKENSKEEMDYLSALFQNEIIAYNKTLDMRHRASIDKINEVQTLIIKQVQDKVLEMEKVDDNRLEEEIAVLKHERKTRKEEQEFLFSVESIIFKDDDNS